VILYQLNQKEKNPQALPGQRFYLPDGLGNAGLLSQNQSG